MYKGEVLRIIWHEKLKRSTLPNKPKVGSTVHIKVKDSTYYYVFIAPKGFSIGGPFEEIDINEVLEFL